MIDNPQSDVQKLGHSQIKSVLLFNGKDRIHIHWTSISFRVLFFQNERVEDRAALRTVKEIETCC